MAEDLNLKNSWTDYQWPEWVPLKIRQEVEAFWLPEWRRGPEQWQQSADYYKAPKLGEVVTLSELIDSHKGVRGRYVHA